MNRSGLLFGALESITHQTLPDSDFEVIVVDNGSSDDTPVVVESFGIKIPNLRYCYDETPGLHIGRHLGMKMAKSDILVYGDDDIEAFPTWLEGILESFQDADVALVGGKDLPKFEGSPPEWLLSMWQKQRTEGRILSQLSVLDLGEEPRVIPPNLVFGCNFSIRKRILLDVGGFHPDGMPGKLMKYRGDGENAVTQAIRTRGLKAFYNPKASVYHVIPKERMTLDYFYRRAFAQGISYSYSRVREAGGMNTQLRVQIIRYKLRTSLAMSIKHFFTKKYIVSLVQSKGHWKGVVFHQKSLSRDPVLLEWILRKDYFASSYEPACESLY